MSYQKTVDKIIKDLSASSTIKVTINDNAYSIAKKLHPQSKVDNIVKKTLVSK